MLLVLALSIFGALVGFGCGNGSTSNGPVTSTPTTSDSLVFTISVPHGNYARGTVVPVTFTVFNTGAQAANFEVATCADFVVQINQGTQEVWTGPSGGCVAITHPLSIAAGATKTYNVTWNQVDSLGNALTTGTYTILAKLTPDTLNGISLTGAQISTFVSNPISVTISP